MSSYLSLFTNFLPLFEKPKNAKLSIFEKIQNSVPNAVLSSNSQDPFFVAIPPPTPTLSSQVNSNNAPVSTSQETYATVQSTPKISSALSHEFALSTLELESQNPIEFSNGDDLNEQSNLCANAQCQNNSILFEKLSTVHSSLTYYIQKLKFAETNTISHLILKK